MENIEKKTPLNDLMDTTMDKIRDMVDSNTIIGEPITTPDGVTVIPVSRGQACGGMGRPRACSCAGCARPRADFRGQEER